MRKHADNVANVGRVSTRQMNPAHGWGMAGEWQDYKVGDLFDLKPGFAFKSPDFVQSGAPVIKIKNVKAGAVVLDNLSYVDERFLDTKNGYIVQYGDILITMSGNRFDGSRETWVGKVGQFLSSEPHLLNQRVAILKPKAGSRLDQRCCSYILGSPEYQDLFIAIATSSGGQANLSPGQILGADILLPPYGEQLAIAHILGTLDDKIELNRRLNTTLEAMAQALFQSWFVDFDPVRAKLDGRKPAGLDAATAALFPAHFQDSPLGHIPQGWKLGVLKDLIDIVIGGDWGSTVPSEEENLPTFCIRGADIPSLQEGGVGKMPTRFLKRTSLEKRRLLGGDLAIEISGGSPTQSTGRPVLVSDSLLQRLEHPLVCSNFCRIVKLKSPSTSKFVYLWLRQVYDNGEFFQFENGTTGIKNLAFTLFAEKYPLVIPPPELCEAFDRVISPMLERHQDNGIQSRTLATLRDALLPKLLSGELSVANVEEEVASV